MNNKNIKMSLGKLVTLAAAANAQLGDSRYFVVVQWTRYFLYAAIFNREEAEPVIKFNLWHRNVDATAIDKITSMFELTLVQLSVTPKQKQLIYHTQLRRLVVLAMYKNWIIEITSMNQIKVHPNIVGPSSFLKNDETDKARLENFIKKVQRQEVYSGNS